MYAYKLYNINLSGGLAMESALGCERVFRVNDSTYMWGNFDFNSNTFTNRLDAFNLKVGARTWLCARYNGCLGEFPDGSEYSERWAKNIIDGSSYRADSLFDAIVSRVQPRWMEHF